MGRFERFPRPRQKLEPVEPQKREQFLRLWRGGMEQAAAARMVGIPVPTAYTIVRQTRGGDCKPSYEDVVRDRDRLSEELDSMRQDRNAWKRYATALEGGHGAEEINAARKAVGR